MYLHSALAFQSPGFFIFFLPIYPPTKAPLFSDGPLTLAARYGAICYLDELVEARANTTVVIHPLTDTRRMLPLAPCNEIVHAHRDFQLVISYNPSPSVREMKASTRQRFCAMEFSYPDATREAEIVAHESGLDAERAAAITLFGLRTRRLQSAGLEEGASTRMLVRAAVLPDFLLAAVVSLMLIVNISPTALARRSSNKARGGKPGWPA